MLLRLLSKSCLIVLSLTYYGLGLSNVHAEPITSPSFPGKCLEAFNQGQPLERGASLRLVDCNGSATQDFRFDQATSTLRLQSPFLCLDLHGPIRSGMGVGVRPCTGTPSQVWAFPFDGRIRTVGIDPNQCLTHASRAGKPATGWTFDSEVDPGCEFPETGGGGFCEPSFALFWELVVSTCSGHALQQWRLPQAGMPFPQDGIVSRRVIVGVPSMRIDDCREIGSCDWKVACGLGNSADVELVGMVEKDTGGTIDIGRQLVHEGQFPVTVTCRVSEFDRGNFFDDDVWEVLGTQTGLFNVAGPGTMVFDHSEGKVTLNFGLEPVGVIAQPQTVEPPPVEPTEVGGFDAMRYAGIDFSVSETELREWLQNPEFTPYPAIAGAIVELLDGRYFARPLFLDVIVSNYEGVSSVSSPRRMSDVDRDILIAAILEAHSVRYGESVADVSDLLR